MPLEIIPVPYPAALDGRAFLISAYPMSKTSGPVDIAQSITLKLGSVFDADGEYVPFEVSHEVDGAGRHKVAAMHKCLDPTLNLVRLAWWVPALP
jgi:hypothetical protein